VFGYQALERLSVSGALLTIAPIARFVAVALAIALDVRHLGSFSAIYLGCVSVAVLAALLWFWPRSPKVTQTYRLIDTIREGAPYVVSSLAVTAGNELDKTIMLRAAGDVSAGLYSAAYRVIQAAILPVNSLVLAVTPRLFKTSQLPMKMGNHLVVFTTIYALLAALATFLLAPLLPTLLGQNFNAAVEVLRAMCIVLVTSSVRQIVVAQLTASDRQSARNWIEGLTAITTVLAMLFIIPAWGVWGAVCVLAAADIVVVTTAWLALAGRQQDSFR
jgi:O-antigen/teichoic acid export membrane protein